MANTSGLSSTPFGNIEALEEHRQSQIQSGQSSHRPKGIPNKITQEGRGFAKTFVDDPRWEEMIWTWVEGVSSRRVEDIVMAALRGEITPEDCAKQVRAAATPMPAGVFNCIMMYRFGKPPQTVKLKGAFGAKPYDGMTETELAARAAALAVELTATDTEKPEASE